MPEIPKNDLNSPNVKNEQFQLEIEHISHKEQDTDNSIHGQEQTNNEEQSAIIPNEEQTLNDPRPLKRSARILVPRETLKPSKNYEKSQLVMQ